MGRVLFGGAARTGKKGDEAVFADRQEQESEALRPTVINEVAPNRTSRPAVLALRRQR